MIAYFQFLSFLNIVMTQVDEIFPRGKQKHIFLS